MSEETLTKMREATNEMLNDEQVLKFTIEADRETRAMRARLYRKVFDVCLVIGLTAFSGVVYGWQMSVIVFGLGLTAIENGRN